MVQRRASASPAMTCPCEPDGRAQWRFHGPSCPVWGDCRWAIRLSLSIVDLPYEDEGQAIRAALATPRDCWTWEASS
jgi:hypothetical protein